MTIAKPKKNRAPLNLLMGLVGLVAICLSVVAANLEWRAPVQLLSMFIVMISLTTMFLTRKSDEYTLGLWSTSANAAFATVIFVVLFGAFGEAIYDGIMVAIYQVEHEREVDGDLAAILALYAFFLTFNIKRLLGAF